MPEALAALLSAWSERLVRLPQATEIEVLSFKNEAVEAEICMDLHGFAWISVDFGGFLSFKSCESRRIGCDARLFLMGFS